MDWKRIATWSLALAPVAGCGSTCIVWHPDERTQYTGFPVPTGVIVELEDGSSDCGFSWLGAGLNPLLYTAAVALFWGVFVLVRRIRARAAGVV